MGNQDGNNSLVSSLNKHKISTIGTYSYCKGAMRMYYFPDKELKLTLRRCYPKIDSNYNTLMDIIKNALEQLNTVNEDVVYYNANPKDENIGRVTINGRPAKASVDVKVGDGAFMKTIEDANILAKEDA